MQRMNKGGFKMIYKEIYKKIDRLTGGINKFCSNGNGYMKLKSGEMMDLHIDVINWKEDGNGTYRIAMAHSFVQNGDLMADPDMEIRIYPDMKMAEALTYQLDSLGIYHQVYPEPGKVNLKLKKELNNFLIQWLNNIEKQEYIPTKKE